MTTWRTRRDPYEDRHRERVARRFRGHVRTPCNPSGRIIRPDRCSWCGRRAVSQGKVPWQKAPTHPRVARIEAHHVDYYARPWAVAWLCPGCHRKAEHRERAGKALPRSIVWDYSSLVRTRSTSQINLDLDPVEVGRLRGDGTWTEASSTVDAKLRRKRYEIDGKQVTRAEFLRRVGGP